MSSVGIPNVDDDDDDDDYKDDDDDYDNDEDVEAWTFTLDCPPGATVIDAGTGTGTRSSTTSTTGSSTSLPSGWQRIRLQQNQPSVPSPSSSSSSSSSPPSHPDTITRTKERRRQQELQQQQHDSEEEDTNERVALLLDDEKDRPSVPETETATPPRQQQQRRDGGGGTLGGGWTFASPYLRVTAAELGTVTYRPAWQGIPEYTNAVATRCHRCCQMLCTAACCCGCRRRGDDGDEQHVDYYKHTWTVHDIVSIRVVSSSSSSDGGTAAPPFIVPGMGECRAVRIRLRSLPTSHVPDVPLHLRSAWERHVRRMRDERNHGTEDFDRWGGHPFTPMDGIDTTTVDESDDGDDDNDNPILWIALPYGQMDPPLLWRFQLPAQDTMPIAVETITMLQGSIRHVPVPKTMPMTSTSPSFTPTHIFINGYQSWSFTGSLLRGHPQPQPALPSYLSRAFNHGATPPPTSAVTVVATADDSAEADSAKTATKTTSTKTKPPKMMYQSDFFTCVTSDGAAPPLRGGRRTGTTDEPKFPFQSLDERGGPAWILGWLSQRHQFGMIEVDENLRHVKMHASAHGQILLPASSSTINDGDDTTTRRRRRRRRAVTTDWAHAQLLSPHSYDEEPLVYFFHAVAGYNAARPLQNGNLLVGWCSWYHYYENISQKVLRDNFAKLAGLRTKVPMNVSVVDDGYMTAWGDWDSLKPNKFTDGGLRTVAADIVRNQMRPGLWLAPFAADKHSQLARQHPDWVIQNDAGVAANSSNCGKFFYGLDATHPDVRQHVATAIHRAVADWKFRVLKIDFLYAACLHGNGKYDLSLSRAQAMHLALDTIRQAAGPDTFLIGCGCPVASAIGYVDGMRVSADTGPTWYPAFPLPWWDHGTLPCLRSMIRNSMARAPMGHRWWHNDPDCLLLGESTRLTIQEVASAASIVAMTCGMMLLSDDLTNVSVERMRVLCKIFPMAGATAVVLDLHSTNDGLPSLLRLWATDRYASVMETYRENHMQQIVQGDSVSNLEHMEATFFARQASFNLDQLAPSPNERKRSCIHVCKGLGTWTIVSISNWSDKPAVLHVPPPALLPPPPSVFDDEQADTFLEGENVEESGEFGFHAFAFWSSKYTCLPRHAAETDSRDDPNLLSRRLGPHETEIYHIKPVTPNSPQYVGSDLHFSCGKEVHRFEVKSMERGGCNGTVVEIQLNPAFNRVGHVFLYLPLTQTEHVRVKVNNEAGHWSVVGNTPQVGSNGSPRLVGLVIRIMVVVHADESPHDGKIQVSF